MPPVPKIGTYPRWCVVSSNLTASATRKTMNRLIHNLHKRCPEGEPRERSRTCGLVVSRSTLNREDESSILSACTMDRVTSSLGLVVRPAVPCVRQQSQHADLAQSVERRNYTPDVVGSIPTVRTNRQRKRQMRLSLPLDVAQLDRAADF